MVLKRLGLIVGGLGLGVCAAEVGVRLAAPIPAEELLFGAPDRSPVGLYQPDGKLFLVPTPGFVGEIGGVGTTVPLRINTLGLRGGEPGAGPKWLAIGDSFTLSVQVTEADHFATRLGAAIGAEVLNAGVDGYSTWQAAERYHQLADRVDVDGVLLTFFLGNDLTDNQRWPMIAQNLDPAHPPPIPARPTPSAWEGFLSDHVRLYGWARVAQRRTSLPAVDRKRFTEELTIFTQAGRQHLDDTLRATEPALAALKAETDRRGDRLMVAVVPPSFAVDAERAAATLATFGLSGPAPDAPRAAVLPLLSQLGIPACDLTGPLSAPGMYLRFDGHWTAAGHAAVAEAEAACLQAR